MSFFGLDFKILQSLGGKEDFLILIDFKKYNGK